MMISPMLLLRYSYLWKIFNTIKHLKSIETWVRLGLDENVTTECFIIWQHPFLDVCSSSIKELLLEMQYPIKTELPSLTMVNHTSDYENPFV